MSPGLRVFLVVALFAAAGCGRGSSMPSEWKAAVEVASQKATVTVDVPGKRMGRDYHPHLSLDGGPEIMMYTQRYTFHDVGPGAHKLRVVIADPQHAPIPGMEKIVPFEVPPDGGAATGQSSD